MNFQLNRLVNLLIVFVMFILLSLGSTGIYTQFTILISVIFLTTSVACKIYVDNNIRIPKSFLYYVIFVFALGVHTYIFNGEFLFFWIFLSGGLVWIHTLYFQNIYSRFSDLLLILLGLMMGILYFYSLRSPINLPNLVSLFSAPTESVKHSNLGDLWAIVLIPVVYKIIYNKSNIYIPILAFGLYFLYISYSRAALFSLSVGIIYLIYKSKNFKTKDYIIPVIFTVILLLFTYFGANKTTLLSRPYFIQSIIGIYRYPLGTGIGNFGLISHDSNMVHNIFLEMLSGMGIFSLFFFVWTISLFKIYTNTSNKTSNNIIIAEMLAITTNFFFNTSYTIPGYVWLFFIVLGLLKNENN